MINVEISNQTVKDMNYIIENLVKDYSGRICDINALIICLQVLMHERDSISEVLKE